jgi:hypothetical protein
VQVPVSCLVPLLSLYISFLIPLSWDRHILHLSEFFLIRFLYFFLQVADLNKERLAQARSFGCKTIDISDPTPIPEQIEKILVSNNFIIDSLSD